METVLNKKINNLNIDKSNWTLVRLGDVVAERRETVKNIATEKIEHIVGLEHIDPENIHLKRSANIESETTFNKKFKKGDVLFGRRRAYLKKAALAPYDGICSGDITVMSAKKGLLPELLPFLINNDKFFDYAVKHSAGGLSPRVKFKDLAQYQFLLPPKDQQAQLAELLWAMDEVVEKEIEVTSNLKRILETTIEKEIHGVSLFGKSIESIFHELKFKRKIVELNTLGKFLKGKGISKSEVIKEGIPCIRYGELYTKHHRIIRSFNSFIAPETAEKSLKLKKNDVLFAGSGETITEIGKSAVYLNDVEAYAGGDVLIFRSKSMDGAYLGYLMNSQLVRQQLNKYGTGATVMHIYNSDLMKLKIPLIGKEEQVIIGNKLEKIATNLKNMELKVKSSQSLQKSLINQIF